MISSATLTGGYASELPCLKGKTFEFSKGLNVLFSPNGTGKSTLLSIMGAYCGINHKSGGWSKAPQPLDLGGSRDKVKFPDSFMHLSPHKCTANIAWDGTPTFINNSATDNLAKHMGYFIDEPSMSPDGLITNMHEQMNAMHSIASQGQSRMNKLNQMFGMIDKHVPDITVNPFGKANDVWSNTGMAFVEYVKSLNPTGRITVLLDEPDKSLSLEMQFFIWHMAFPKISVDRQLIIATHCPLALSVASANIIDLQEGYIDTAKTILKSIDGDLAHKRTATEIVQAHLMKLLKEIENEQKAETTAKLKEADAKIKKDTTFKERKARQARKIAPKDRTAEPIVD